MGNFRKIDVLIVNLHNNLFICKCSQSGTNNFFMRRILRLFLIASCFQLLSCESSKKILKQASALPATALQPYGRSAINDVGSLELISSAAHFGFSFEGKECKMFVSIPDEKAHNYLQYVLDGIYQKRILIAGNNKQPIILTALADGKHTIWIYKATEATTGPIFIQKITGKKIKAIRNPAAPLVEFIGNSITCGAAADDSEVPCNVGEYHDHHNAYFAYGPRVARALGVNFMVTSVSGIGIYRSWNSDGPAMPQVYEKTGLQENDNRLWNFDTYTPKVVSIALGTNDLSNGDGIKKRLPFDSSTFVSNYIRFVQLVKSKYPKAKVVLLNSPMIDGQKRMLLQNCLEAVKVHIDVLYPSAKSVALFTFKPMQPHGCSGHPSVQDHALLATELIPFFRQLLQ